MQPVVVTGATGNVGVEVVALLRGAGLPVRAAVRDPVAAQARLGAGLEYTVFDFTRPQSWTPAFAGARSLFLMRPPSIADTRRLIAPAIAAAARAGIEQVVFLSLLGIEGNRFLPHYAVEQALRDSGLSWTFLRAGFFMQNLSTVHRDDIRDRGDIFVPAGRGKTSFIDVRDIAAVGAKALSEPGHAMHAYDLTGAEALTYAEVAQIFSEVLGRPITYSSPSPLRFASAMLRRGLAPAYVLMMVAIYTTTRLGLAAHIAPDTARLLGRAPGTIRTFVNDYRKSWSSSAVA